MIQNKHTTTFKPLLIAVFATITSLSFLTSCGDSSNLLELCHQNQEICHEFSEDSWCKKQRIDVALARIAVKENNLDKDKYRLILGYEGYIRCMELASQIQHIKLKEKTTLRNNNLLKAKANLSELTAKNSNSKHPHLLYYYWSREGNKASLAEFLALEGTPELENSIAQYNLATYYIKRNSKKALGFIFHSLELHEPGTSITPEVFQSLTTIFTKRKQYKQAYIWLRAYQLSLDKPDETIELSLHNYQETHALDESFLDAVASTTLDKIKSGNFVSPKF